MKDYDLARELESTLSASVRALVSEKLGLSADVVGLIVTAAAPVLIAALMAAGATSHGAPNVWAAVMSSANDARIAERLDDRLRTTAGLSDLEEAGQRFARACLSTSVGELGDCIAAELGVPAQSASASMAVVTAILGGLLKQHMLIEQAEPADLTSLLAGQWAFIESRLSDRRATTLRLEGAAAFRDAIPAQLRVLAGIQRREPVRPLASPGGAAEASAAAADKAASTAALMDDRAGRATLRWLVALTCLVTIAATAAVVLLPSFRQPLPRVDYAVGAVVPASAPASAHASASFFASALKPAPKLTPPGPSRR